MTRDEAMKVWAIVSTADGGCPSCVGDLVNQLVKDFPDWPWEQWREEDDPWKDAA